MVTEEVGEDADDGDDAGNPVAISCTRTKRTTRRIRWTTSLGLWRLQTMATKLGEVTAMEGRGEEREHERE